MSASSAVASKAVKRVTKKTDETVAAVAAPVAVAAATPATPKAAVAKATKATKAATTTAVATPVAAAIVAAPVAAASAAVETAAAGVEAVVEETRLEDEVRTITTALLSVREQVSRLITDAKKLEKRSAKLQKLADKRRRRRVAVDAEGKPARISIFLVPTPMSNDLCAFMGRPSGSLESRSNVTKFITNYVKENNLKNKHDINADAKMRKLLNLTEADKLTYFNLQKYLNVHYLKTNAAAAAAAATATATA